MFYLIIYKEIKRIFIYGSQTTDFVVVIFLFGLTLGSHNVFFTVKIKPVKSCGVILVQKRQHYEHLTMERLTHKLVGTENRANSVASERVRMTGFALMYCMLFFKVLGVVMTSSRLINYLLFYFYLSSCSESVHHCSLDWLLHCQLMLYLMCNYEGVMQTHAIN